MDAVPLFPSSEKPGPPSATFYGPSAEADTEPSRFTVVDVTVHNVVVLIQEAQQGGSQLYLAKTSRPSSSGWQREW